MKPVWLLFGLLLLIGVVVRAAKRHRKSRAADLSSRWPLEAKHQVMSDRERVLFGRLREALPGHVILAQAQLIQLLNFERGARTQTLFNRICQLSVDFVVLNPDTSILAAIELDDATHERADRRDADARKTHALQSAGVRLIRWNAKTIPDSPAILAELGTNT